jgi:hypothetical protein
MNPEPAFFEQHQIRRICDEATESVTNCHRLNLAAADGRHYLTDYWADHDIREGRKAAVVTS